jgi:hypothetical protein
MKTVPEILREAAALFEQRNPLYKDSYKGFGPALHKIFADSCWSPTARSDEDGNRLGVFMMCVVKLHRYATTFEQGGHYDSALDLSVYSAMLAELTQKEPLLHER